MATKIGLVGPPNSGKSYSRRHLKGEEVFLLMPSDKLPHLTLTGGAPLKRATYSLPNTKTTEKTLEVLNSVYDNKYKLRKYMLPHYQDLLKSHGDRLKGLKVEGDYEVIKHLQYLEAYLWYISDNMPEKKIVFLPDFTHYISEIISKKSFIDQKSGGQAFQRFWELAGQTLNAFFTQVDEMRDDLFLITEFHSEYEEVEEQFKIFVPAGKMLSEKFKPESYYDDLYFTHTLKNEDTNEVANWVFYVNKYGPFNARNGWGCKDLYLPNDLNPIISKIRKLKGV